MHFLFLSWLWGPHWLHFPALCGGYKPRKLLSTLCRSSALLWTCAIYREQTKKINSRSLLHRTSSNISFSNSVALSSEVWCRVAIITETDEDKGDITSGESSLQLSPTEECAYAAELKGCDRWVVTWMHQRTCRVEWPIYIPFTNGCLIRRGWWDWPFLFAWELWWGCYHTEKRLWPMNSFRHINTFT